MNILLTGGCGFIGIAITEKLLKDGHTVVIFDRNPLPHAVEQLFHRMSDTWQLVRGDVLDQQLIESTIRSNKLTAVIHAAAITPDVDFELSHTKTIVDVNAAGTAVLLSAAHRTEVQQFIHVSTAAIYGPAQWEEEALFEDLTVPRPQAMYEITKYAAEQIVRRYRQLTGMNICIVRLGDVFGAWEYPSGARTVMSAPYQTFRLAKRGEQARLPRPGQKYWVYSRDIAHSLAILLTTTTRQFETYHLSSEFRWSIGEWCSLLQKSYPAFHYEIVEEPEQANVVFRPDHSPLDIQRLITDTGYVPAYDMVDSLQDYQRWAREYPGFIN